MQIFVLTKKYIYDQFLVYKKESNTIDLYKDYDSDHYLFTIMYRFSPFSIDFIFLVVVFCYMKCFL